MRSYLGPDIVVFMTLPTTTREMKEQDLPAVRRVGMKCFPWCTSLGELRKTLTTSSGHSLVTVVDDVIVGYVLVEFTVDDICVIETLAVLPDYENNGIGSALLKKVITSLSPGCSFINLKTSPYRKGLVEFYDKFGFKLVGNPNDLDFASHKMTLDTSQFKLK